LDNVSDNIGAISLSVDKASFCRTPAPPTITGLQSQGVAGDGDPALTEPIENA